MTKFTLKRTFFALLSLIICLISGKSSAQNAPDLNPSNNIIKDTSRQKDMMDMSKKWFILTPKRAIVHEQNKIYFTINPLANTPASSGNALVTSTIANVYLGPPSTTFLSTATFAPYFNFNRRFGLPLRSNLWLKDNAWNIRGDLRFLVYPQYTWGLGSKNSNEEKQWVNYKYIRLYESVLKQIRPHLYMGLGYDLDYHFNIGGDSGVNLQKFTGYPFGLSGNSLSSGLTFNILYDIRNRNIEPFPGTFLNIIYRINPGFLGNRNSWQSAFLDLRKYLQLNPPAKASQQNTLAFWSFFWWNSNTGTPYLDLPSTGWDEYNRSARGFDHNRYRGNELFYFETEYRRDITNNGLLGFVLFSNINTVSGSGTLFKSWHPAGGLGLRIKYKKVSNTNFAIDFAFSQGYRTILFNFSERF